MFWFILGLFFWILADVQDASPLHADQIMRRAFDRGIPIIEYRKRCHDATTNIGTVFVVVAIVLWVLRLF